MNELPNAYMQGFNDELSGTVRSLNDDLLFRAYNMGRFDAIIGDDASGVDKQTDEEILNRIKNK